MDLKVVVIVVVGVLCLLVCLGDGSVTGLGLLAPLIPVAQITGHAGLWAHGLTSAALLKLKAAGVLGGLFLLSGRGIELNVGNDNGGWGWGWGEKRRKRDVDGSELMMMRRDDVDYYEDSTPPQVSMDEMVAYDQAGCGMRFVCELSATPLSQLSTNERMILELFGRDDTKTKQSSNKMSYNYASSLGSTAKDGARACARVYGQQCPFSRNDIMGMLSRN